MKLLFWMSVGIVAYTFFLYPIALLLMASVAQLWADLRFGMKRMDRRRRSSAPRTVSLVVAAHNEQAVILEKLANLAALDYPADKVEILLGCDGCSDQTAALAAGTGIPGLRVLEYPRGGKPLTLNRLMREASGDVVVFSDANSMFALDALQALTRHFDDETVGSVCGEMKLRTESGAARTEGLYWRYESFLKFLESRLNMLVGANGANFAIRRTLYTELPPGTITDDFLIPMQIRAKGARFVYDPEAAAYEDSSKLGQEFKRKKRIGAGNMHALRHTWKLLSPTAGPIAFSYWSHKVLRWMAPVAMLAALGTAFPLAVSGGWLYQLAAGFGAGVVALTAAGYIAEKRHKSAGICSVLLYFFAMNLALLTGIVSSMFGKRYTVWAPTVREPVGPAGVPGLGQD